MNIHEYQAKQIMAKYGLSVPNGYLTSSVEEALDAAEKLKLLPVVIKAQVHAGGRGKAGGVKIAKSKQEVAYIAEQMLGMTLINAQTGKLGKKVRKIYVEECTNISKELYLSLLLDRDNLCITIIASTEGGIDIEEVAENSPDKIMKISIDPTVGLCDYQIRALGFYLNIPKAIMHKFKNCIYGLYRAFTEKNAIQIEINPLVITVENNIVPLDAKFNFDDNALFLSPDVIEMRDVEEEEPLERRASENGLSYVKMEGNIGCIVNGAGLAMATMDIIKSNGGFPANFLDVGGSATDAMVEEAFKIILSDCTIKAILVNIFGGIMKCDIIANGAIKALKSVSTKIPIIIRLDGTNSDIAKDIIKTSGMPLFIADNLKDAAIQAVLQAKC